MDYSQLSFGLAGKIFQYRISLEDLSFGRDDEPLLVSGIENGYIPDMDFGMYWTNNDFFLGASVNNLFQSIVNFGGSNSSFKINRHYWLMGGYKFKLRREFEVEPNILVKTTEQWLPQGDFGVKFYYMKDYWAGLAFRTDGSLITLLGMKASGLYIGYAFDLTFSSIQRFNYGTHELSISYKFGNAARRYRWLRRY
jgi:type IX secretion system PorP/SprF family membrane protein